MRRFASCATAAFLFAAASAAPVARAGTGNISAWPPDGGAIADQGLGPSVPACASCHGMTFQGDASKGAPRLAGRDAADMMDALAAMAGNPEDKRPMATIARHLDMGERAAVTAWLSQRPVRP